MLFAPSSQKLLLSFVRSDIHQGRVITYQNVASDGPHAMMRPVPSSSVWHVGCDEWFG